MKSKFKLGFLHGFKFVPGAWPGKVEHLKITERILAPIGGGENSYVAEFSKDLVFECTKIDDDHAAVFEFIGAR